jgi:hypothetical protein
MARIRIGYGDGVRLGILFLSLLKILFLNLYYFRCEYAAPRRDVPGTFFKIQFFVPHGAGLVQYSGR